MHALWIAGTGSLTLREIAPPPASSDCRIRVRLAGICGTDLQLLEGYAGFEGVPGHEFVGVVDQVPAGDERWLGRRVVGEINVGCGRCRWCASGVKEHCPERTVVGIRGRSGAFAEHLWLPAANLHEVPDAVDDQAAVFVEPVAAACRILEQVPLDDRTSVVVVGDGRLGLLVAQVLKTATPDVAVVGRHDAKLDVARALGLATSLDRTPLGSRVDVVVEATGRPDGLARALELVRPRGTVVLKSTFHGEAPAALWPAVVQEISIVGSRCGPFRPAIDLLTSGSVQTRPLVSRVLPLEDYAAAFACARRELKVLMAPSSSRSS